RPDGSVFEGDLACDGGTIARIDSSLSTPAREVIDANGHLLLPGVIDPQVHFREPGAPQKEDIGSGSRAAVSGGVTSFLEMPNTNPPTTDQPTLNGKLARAAQKSVANYGFFIGATATNLKELNTVSPTCGIKIFMGASTGDLLVDDPDDLERIFANGDRLIAVHAESEKRIKERRALFAERHDPAVHSEIRDNQCALAATELALELSTRYRRRLHILHMSTHEEVELLRAHKPPWVTAEVIPNHLFLNVDDYASQGTRVQMNPPLRQPEDNLALWQGLCDGIIDFIATDHAPHTLAEKQEPYPQSPSGMPGVETSLPLLLTQMVAGRCTLAQIQRWLCLGPAMGYGIANKGKIQEGWDADITLVDINEKRAVCDEDRFTRVRWSPYSGRELTGWPVYTIVAGQVAFDQGHIRRHVHGHPLQFAAQDT
ncbi:MAG: dihydroorotase, partial [Acidiferrobacterales bacterium]|nr:dihydroorotase [Acidiferrobacterales bacterium]